MVEKKTKLNGKIRQSGWWKNIEKWKVIKKNKKNVDKTIGG